MFLTTSQIKDRSCAVTDIGTEPVFGYKLTGYIKVKQNPFIKFIGSDPALLRPLPPRIRKY
jgi:hypothetical protein